jgi:hypothetical protein
MDIYIHVCRVGAVEKRERAGETRKGRREKEVPAHKAWQGKTAIQDGLKTAVFRERKEGAGAEGMYLMPGLLRIVPGRCDVPHTMDDVRVHEEYTSAGSVCACGFANNAGGRQASKRLDEQGRGRNTEAEDAERCSQVAEQRLR